MGTLTLIRHGQAMPFEKAGDRLSDIGRDQAQALADFWIRQGTTFSEIYSGTLNRQKATAEIVGQQMASAGLDWPAIHPTPEFNEYDADGLITKLVPALAQQDESFREHLAAFELNRNSRDRNRYFQKMFESVTSVWLDGSLEVDGVESWPAFSSRVRGAFKRLIDGQGSGRRIAVFTSGGVIGLAVQSAVDAPARKALEINWRVRNCSLTEFVFSRGRLSLDTFNAIPHLSARELQTFR